MGIAVEDTRGWTPASDRRPQGSSVVLDGKEIADLPSQQVARRLGLLPQTALAPDGITVEDLIARGRYPYQSTLRQWSRADAEACREAMRVTATADLAPRLVDELSGGQRQRVWLAMVLDQQTDLLLLEEPTTFLDIAHQVQLMELLTWLHREAAPWSPSSTTSTRPPASPRTWSR